jgi:5'-nucleotidase (lipoprotein e(P4) family)
MGMTVTVGDATLRRQMSVRRLFVLVIFLALAAWRQPAVSIAQTSAPAKPAAAVDAVPADDDLQATLWTQRAVEHDLVFREIYRNAKEKLKKAIADPKWNALPLDERKGAVRSRPPAVILDVDETILDNSPYQARLIRSGEEYGELSWKKWCHEEAANPLPGAVEFTRYAAAHGVAVYYVTNRSTDLEAATLDNLRKVGFPVTGSESLLGLGTVVKDCEQVGSDKGCRRQLVGRTHRVLMQFGDQIDDFVGVIANTPDDRAKSVQPYLDWIGERWWVLPNPMYGSWAPAQFNNDWTQPRAARRRAEINALRTN